MDTSSFLSNSFSDLLQAHKVDLDAEINIPLLTQMKIDCNEWFQWMSDHWDEGQTLPYIRSDSIKQETTNRQIELAAELGYSPHNTSSRQWGRSNLEHTEQFKQLIGAENWKKIDIDPDTVLIKLLCYFPGNFLPLHWDEFEPWQQRFNTDVMPTRLSVLINPWSWGHYLQIHSHVITRWNPGDVYCIPSHVWHCSGNGGILPKVTLTITGTQKGELNARS